MNDTIAADLHRDDRLLIGASWYPEMWPSEEWPRDIARMRELGFNVVRLFEFAWHRFEPEEGRFETDWAVALLDMLHEAGIGAMIGTPSAAPPAWLTAKYPEVLRIDAKGRRATHGQRKHGSHISRRYRSLCERIVTVMAEALGHHPAVHSWQIDNEMGGRDFGEEAFSAFHRWLRQRYETPEKMNEIWGLEFWSQAYSDFAQVPMPTADVGSIEVPERHHPSLLIALARFNNAEWSDYIGQQCETIRRRASRRVPITTNMVGSMAMNWFTHNRHFDRVGHSMYKDVDHYAWNVINFDRMRAEKDYAPYWLLETAPNWSGGGRIWNIHRNKAGVQAMAWMNVFLGGSMMLFWQWRQHWAGQEMQHGTHVTATGRWRPNKDAWQALADRFREHGAWLLARPPRRAELAVMLDNEAAWAWSIDPIDQEMRYHDRIRDDFHLPLMRAHLWRDVIGPEADLSPYKVLLIPMMPMVSDRLRQRLRPWVEDGGRLVLGPYTGYRTEEFTCFREQEFGGLETLMGATSALSFTPMWVEDRIHVEFADGTYSATRTFCDAFEPTEGEPIAWYRQPASSQGHAEGYGHNTIAAVRNRLGSGEVVTLGCRIDEPSYLHLVRGLCEEAGIAPVARGDGEVLVCPRADATGTPAGWGVVNLADDPRRIELTDFSSGTDLLTGRRVEGGIDLAPLEAMLIRPD